MSFNVMFGIVVAVFIGAWFYSGNIKPQYSSGDQAGPEATVERIRPLGQVRVAGQEVAARPAPVVDKGQEVVAQTVAVAAAATDAGLTTYQAACGLCHAAGLAGAPKLGDVEAWKPRIAQGLDVLNHNAIAGIGAMPAKGGRMDLSDNDVKAAVVYMVEKSGTP